jgi:hypothetical protein
MSKLFENKQQLVHIASEVVVLLGLTFYFNSQNKKLTGHIEDLAQRIEEQEDLIQNHETIIKQLVEQVNKLGQRKQPTVTQTDPRPLSPKILREKRKPSRPAHSQPPLERPSASVKVSPRVHFIEQKSKIVEVPRVELVTASPIDDDIFEESEEDLNLELSEELADLDNDDDLKKDVLV